MEVWYFVTENSHYFCTTRMFYKCNSLSIQLVWTKLKVPLLWVMKGSYFGFGSPQQQVDISMQSQKTLSLSNNMHSLYFYLTCTTIHFSKSLLCMTLICGDWSIGLIFISSCLQFLIKLLVGVQRYRGNRYFYAPEAAPSGKEWICFFIQTNAKKNNMWACNSYANVSCWLQHEKAWDRFKNDSFQWFRVDAFFWETITLYTVHFQI